MNIAKLYSKKKTVISFEIFPPKYNYPIETVYKTIEDLKELKPDYISVTYGAGGSTKDRTVEIASYIKNELGIESLAHLTCVTSTKDEVTALLGDLKKNNIENIMALRGDLPENSDVVFPNPLQYRYASDLIKQIKTHKVFCAGAAAYPEGHPNSTDIDSDMEYLKYKVDTGADFLVSQMFFDNKYFFEFMERLKKFNISVPVSAGIMPITNKKQIKKMSELSCAKIPKPITDKLNLLNDSKDVMKYGIDNAVSQIQELIDNGVSGIHLYTMNKPQIAKAIINKLQI